MFIESYKSKYLMSSDGVRLHYLEAGVGKPLVLIHGWSQSALEFKYIISELSKYYWIVAIDLRGHGNSDKPSHGYRISRLAKDVYETLVYLGMQEVNLLGWSMGCSIVLSYWDLFGSERLSKMILVDQPGWLLKTEENELGLWTFDELITINATEDDRRILIEENLKMPPEYSAHLAFIHWLNAWRDIIPTINIPALIIGGKKSFINWHSQVWNSEKIAGSQLELFEERGHLMFFEEPERFNKLVIEFVG